MRAAHELVERELGHWGQASALHGRFARVDNEGARAGARPPPKFGCRRKCIHKLYVLRAVWHARAYIVQRRARAGPFCTMASTPTSADEERVQRRYLRRTRTQRRIGCKLAGCLLQLEAVVGVVGAGAKLLEILLTVGLRDRRSINIDQIPGSESVTLLSRNEWGRRRRRDGCCGGEAAGAG